MKKWLNEFITVFGILTIITFGWQILEFVYYGKLMPDDVDGIVAMILTYSLYCNLKKWK